MGQDQRVQVSLHIPTTAAGTGQDDFVTFNHPGTWLIEDQELMPNASVAADATDYSTYTLYNVTDSVTIMSHATNPGGQGALTAGTAVLASPTVTGADRRISQGDVLRLRKADSGSGKAGAVRATLVLVNERQGA